MRLRIKIDDKIVGDYPDDLMKVPQNMVKIIQNHLHDEFKIFIMEWYDENKTK